METIIFYRLNTLVKTKRGLKTKDYYSFMRSSYLIVLRYRKDISVAKGLNISAQTSPHIIWICYPFLAFEGIVIQDKEQSMLFACLKLTISMYQFILVSFKYSVSCKTHRVCIILSSSSHQALIKDSKIDKISQFIKNCTRLRHSKIVIRCINQTGYYLN